MPSRRRLLGALGVLLALGLTVPPVLVRTAGLDRGDTALLPGSDTGSGYAVSGSPAEVSYALDVHNGSAVPVTVRGLADPRLGPYDATPGRGGPGGGLPEREGFAPFRLWPGQTRLVVVHLTRSGPPAPLRVTHVRLDATVLGVSRVLAVPLPEPLSVS